MARHFSLLLLLLTQMRALKIFGTPGRGPAIQRMYPDNAMVKCDYWLGAGQLTSATVDNVRGLQKCVKVLSVAVYTDEEDFEGGRFGAASDAVCGADVWVPFRVMSEAASLDEVASIFETAAAGEYYVGGKKPRSSTSGGDSGSGGAAKKPAAESGAIAEGLRGAFNVLGKAQKNLGIFGLSDDDNKGE